MQGDARAAPGARDGLHRELAVRRRFPLHALFRRGAGLARDHGDAVGDDEGRIEAHAELADARRILLLVAGELAEELAGTGFGDGAEVSDRLLARHADAVVAHGERARLRVDV